MYWLVSVHAAACGVCCPAFLLCQKDEGSPQKKRKKEEEKGEVWKWWEEERLPEGVKWRTLEHSVCGGEGKEGEDVLAALVLNV